MSSSSYALNVLPEMYGADKPAPLQTKATIAFSEFVRPDSYWPQPYSLEQAFQVYRWFVKTGRPFSEYRQYGAYDTLIGRGVMGSTDLRYEPICSVRMLREVFHRAILGRTNGERTNSWREKERIAFGGSRVISFPHYKPFVGTPLLGRVLSEAQIERSLTAYFSASGNLIVQLNESHARAVEIVYTVIRVQTHEPFYFKFDLGYGYDGSVWWRELASGAQFIDSFGVALSEFERISGRCLLDEVAA